MEKHIGQIHNYILIKHLGNGGSADVYLAKHRRLKVPVAIKIFRDPSMVSESFLDEVQTSTRLHHPHIIRIIDIDLDEHGLPYLVMDYAQYGTLRQLYRPGQPQLPDIILPYIQQVAQALDYVHQQQIIHRDVKPENLLLGPHQRVLLSDFGIAIPKRIESASVLGTFSYTAPEQILGKPHFASDQYSLGIVVYEWLCGTRPFTGTLREIMDKQVNIEPPPMCNSSFTLSAAISQVIFTALAKDPTQRYPTVTDFAQAFAQACHTSTFTLPMAQETPSPSPIPGDLTITVLALPPLANNSSPTEDTKLAYSPGISKTSEADPVNKLGTTTYIYPGHCRFVNTVAWSPDHSLIASGGEDYQTHFWYETTRDSARVDHYKKYVWSIHWSPKDKRVVVGNFDQFVRIVDVATGDILLTYKKHHKLGYGKASAAWSPDGQYIASGGSNHLVHIWDAITGQTLHIFQGHTDEVNAVAWSPDGKYLASASYDKTVRIWNTATGDTLLLYKHIKGVNAVTWSPDSTHIASASNDATVHMWNIHTKEWIHTFEHFKRVQAVSWSPSGIFLATGCHDHMVYVWNATTGDHRLTYSQHEDAITALAWSPDSIYLASGSYDKTVHVWKASILEKPPEPLKE